MRQRMDAYYPQQLAREDSSSVFLHRLLCTTSPSQSCKGKVTLTICHPMGLSPPTLPPNQMDFNQPDIEIEGPQPRHMFQSRPPPPYGSANVDRVPPPYSSSSPSQVPITLLRPTPVYGSSPDYVSQHHQHLHHQGPGGMYRGERKAPSPPMQEDTDPEE